MKLSDFDFNLPSELIAYEPVEQRDQSNLILPFDNNKIVKFANIIDYLNPGDVMVFNDSRVINSKITLEKSGTKININLNKPSLTHCPSSTAFAIPLGPTNPWMIDITKETLIFRRGAFSTPLRLLVPTFLLPHAPEALTSLPSQQSGTLSYHS